MKFDINKKGYDTEQVDNFINKLSIKYEEKLSEQKDRVFSLKNELALMEERLETYKDKDKQISQALIYAVEKAEQIENNASKLYDLEIKRIRLIYKQWEELMMKVGMIDAPTSLKKEINIFFCSIYRTTPPIPHHTKTPVIAFQYNLLSSSYYCSNCHTTPKA